MSVHPGADRPADRVNGSSLRSGGLLVRPLQHQAPPFPDGNASTVLRLATTMSFASSELNAILSAAPVRLIRMPCTAQTFVFSGRRRERGGRVADDQD